MHERNNINMHYSIYPLMARYILLLDFTEII